jgi:hypothetical protein
MRVAAALLERLPPAFISQNSAGLLALAPSTAQAGLLAILQPLAPILHQTAGEATLRETIRAVVDTAQWRP